ncbi:MAG: ClbS/DfsB family four-helix bundle protein, partial [Spirochaetaceae bacterium]|nr:ClbS/DfsB family four-helix bundle protein [Spirochaetaceae bacterium]
MARATSKAELIAAANDQWSKMWKMIDAVPGGAQSVVFNFGDDPMLKEAHWGRDKNMRDVLVHLYEWHQLLLTWVKAN